MADSKKPTVLPSASEEEPAEEERAPADTLIADGPEDYKGLAIVVLAVIGTILMLQFAKTVLIPVVVAVLISYVLGPAVTSMHKHGLPRFLGSILVITLLCGGLGLAVYTLTDEAMAIVENVPRAARRLAERMEPKGAPEGAFEKVQAAAKEVERAAEQASDPRPVAKGVTRVQIVQPAFAATDYLWTGGVGVVAFMGQLAMVLFLVFFLLVTGDLFKRKLVKIAGPTLTRKKITVQIMDEINKQISGFLRVQVITSAAVAVATSLVLWWFGVQQFVVWGLLAGIFNSIPYLGPLVVTVRARCRRLHAVRRSPQDRLRVCGCAGDHEPRGMAADADPDGTCRTDESRGDFRGTVVLELGMGRHGHNPGRPHADGTQGGLRSDRGAAARG